MRILLLLFIVFLSIIFSNSSLYAQEINIGDSIKVTPGKVKIGGIEVNTDEETINNTNEPQGKSYSAEDFNDVDLSGKSFAGATFFGVDFNNANLSYVDFTGAKFTGVDFNNAIIKYACFINAKFTGGDFKNSDLSGSVFTGSSRTGTQFVNTDLDEVVWEGVNICPSKSDAVTERPEVTKAQDIKTALLEGPDTKIDLTVNFPSGSDEIKAKAHVQVLEIATAIKSPELANKRILIEGHTDNVGEEDYNIDLSYKRAVRIMRILSEEYEIDSNRLQVKGFGETAPIISNDTDQGRAINRRVTLVNMGNL